MTNTTLKLSNVKRSSSYQFRAETNESWIEELVEMLEAGEQFTGEDAPKVAKLNGAYWLYDGFHRTSAGDKFGLEEMEFSVVDVESEYDLMMLAIKANVKHGQRNSTDDFKKMTTALINSERREDFMKNMFALDVKKLAKAIGCTERHVRTATAALRENLDKDMDTFVLDKHDEGLSNRKIAELIGCGSKTVDRIVNECVKTEEFQNDAVSTHTPSPSEVPMIDAPTTSDMEDDLWDDEESFSLATDTLNDVDSVDDLPFDIEETDAVKLVSAADRGDEVDTKAKEAVKLEEQLKAIRTTVEFIPDFSTEALLHLQERIASELARRGE